MNTHKNKLHSLLAILLIFSALGESTAHAAFLPAHLRGEFQFIIATDSHLGDSRGNANTRKAFAHMKENYEGASFMVHMGDVTETGSTHQYDIFEGETSSLPFPVYATVGNHEAKWNDPVASEFTGRFGPTTCSFDYGLWHFVVLDTTFPSETLGTLGPETLAWLEKDLSKVAPHRPIALFSHHPLGYQPSTFHDADEDLMRLLGEYNIRAVFGGHGHCFIPWKAGGSDFLMVGALLDGAYAVGKVNGYDMTVWSVDALNQNPPELVKTITGTRPDSPVADLRVTVEEGTLFGEYTLHLPAIPEIQVDTGPFVSLGRKSEGLNTFNLGLSDYPEGTHTVTLRVTTDDGPYYLFDRFSVQGDRILWEKDLEAAAVGNLLPVSPGKVIVGTRDGDILCLSLQDGRQLWRFEAGSPWGGGALDGHRLIFGTNAGHVYCLNSEDGSLTWRTTVDPMGFCAPPVVHQSSTGKSIYIGSVSGKFYCLNAFLALKKWEFETGGAIVSAPSVGQGHVYFGAWDNSLYALREDNGELAWKRALGRQIYYSPWAEPVFSRGKVFTVTPYDTHTAGYAWALDAATGETVWQYETSSTLQSPVLTPNVGLFAGQRQAIAVGTYGGNLILLSPETGKVISKAEGTPGLFSSPAISEGVRVTGGQRGLLTVTTTKGSFSVKLSNRYAFLKPSLGRLYCQEEGQTIPVVIAADSGGKVWAVKTSD